MPGDSNLDTDAGFVRQRRNLILISIALLASLHFQLTLDKINFLGNETRLPEPKSVATVLWWMWGYLLWRYITSFIEVNKGLGVAWSNYSWRSACRYGDARARAYVSKVSPELITRTCNAKSGSLEGWNLVMQAQLIKKSSNSDTGDPPFEWVVPKWTIAWCRFLGLVYLCIQTSKVSEYIVPYVIAAAPVFYWLTH